MAGTFYIACPFLDGFVLCKMVCLSAGKYILHWKIKMGLTGFDRMCGSVCQHASS